MKTRVVNKYIESFDVYIGRGSIWGNPFVMGRDGDRDEVIEKYELWLLGHISAPGNPEKPTLTKAKQELKGRVLGCFCKPKNCHGDVLVKILER
jgi:hypothetical protein